MAGSIFGSGAIDSEAAPWGSVGVEERFAPLVATLEREAATHPRAYVRRVVGAGILGLAFVVLVLGFFVAVLIGLGFLMWAGTINLATVKFALLAGLLSLAILRSLWVRMDPPKGRPIDRSEAPALYEMIDSVRATTGGPKLHGVFITEDFNAAILQHPRYGPFGGYQNYLIVGLPLLHGMSSAEIVAVVAHEYGHLSGEHGRAQAWIYRLRTIWWQLSSNLKGGHTANLLRRFFRWYGPWFNAYSFVLARAHEYGADSAAAAATSSRTAADALIRAQLQSRRQDQDYWRQVWRQSLERPQPIAMPFAAAATFLAETTEGAEATLAASLSERTGLDDTHPCLAERLAALGQEPRIPPPLADTGAQVFLGDRAAAIASEFDAQWWEAVEDEWEACFRLRQEEVAELAELDVRADRDALAVDDKLRRADLTGDIRGAAAALPLLDDILSSHPDHSDANFRAGKYRLELGDRSGISLLEHAMNLDPDVEEEACCVILEVLEKGSEDFAGFAERLDTCRERLAAADNERRTLSRDMVFKGLQATVAEALGAELLSCEGLNKVWAANRALSQSSSDQYLILVAVRRGYNVDSTLDEVLSIAQRHAHAVAISEGQTTWLSRRIKREGVRIL